MPRKPRYFLPDIPTHIVQRGHSRSPVFFENEDYLTYLHYLKEGSERYEVSIHAYVLMTNHIHLLSTSADKEGVGRMMQYIGRYYVPYINYKYGSSGSIWEGRYKANLVQNDGYLLTCMRYIELNPVRADMAKSPGTYRWSSYKYNALGKDDKLITPHPVYKKAR
jgi:REP-associated tyrosine transposase